MMPVHCPWCNSENLRLSRFRFIDVFYLLALHYPVRCRECRARILISLFKVRQVWREANARRLREYRKKFVAYTVPHDSRAKKTSDGR